MKRLAMEILSLAAAAVVVMAVAFPWSIRRPSTTRTATVTSIRIYFNVIAICVHAVRHLLGTPSLSVERNRKSQLE